MLSMQNVHFAKKLGEGGRGVASAQGGSSQKFCLPPFNVSEATFGPNVCFLLRRLVAGVLGGRTS